MSDDLTTIPGVGPSIARDLRDLGCDRVSQLRDEDSARMFTDLCALRGEKVDRCVHSVFRCAVSIASAADHDPELLEWWAWQDGSVRDEH